MSSIQGASDAPALTASEDGFALVWNNATQAFVTTYSKFRLGNSGHLFSNAAVTGAFPSAAANELLLSVDLADGNVLAVQNKNAAGYSAYTARGNDGHEYMAMGYGNPSAVSIFAGVCYIEAWSGKSGSGAPKVLRITQDGDYGTIGSGFRFYNRASLEIDGAIIFWKLIPWADGSEQAPILTILAQGNVGIEQDAPTAALDLPASTTARASFRMRTGVAPTSPNAGDTYQDNTHAYMWLAGAWKQMDN